MEKPHLIVLSVAMVALIVAGVSMAQLMILSGQLSAQMALTEELGSEVDKLSGRIVSLEVLPGQISRIGERLRVLEGRVEATPAEIFEFAKYSVVSVHSFGVGEGAGFAYDAAGHIVTNHHVVDGATSIEVSFLGGSVYEATLVGSDPSNDIALLRVDAPTVPLPLGDSSGLRVGDRVVAIGNPLGLTASVTAGIVSQLNRNIPTADFVMMGLIQTDAAVNPGNSGGPLLNMRGEVVGVITLKAREAEGLGFAVSSNTLRAVVSSILAG